MSTNGVKHTDTTDELTQIDSQKKQITMLKNRVYQLRKIEKAQKYAIRQLQDENRKLTLLLQKNSTIRVVYPSSTSSSAPMLSRYENGAWSYLGPSNRSTVFSYPAEYVMSFIGLQVPCTSTFIPVSTPTPTFIPVSVRPISIPIPSHALISPLAEQARGFTPSYSQQQQQTRSPYARSSEITTRPEPQPRQGSLKKNHR